MKSKVGFLAILGLLFASEVQAGGGFSRVATGIGLGIVTGGAGIVLGATVEAATAAGVATAIGVGANQRTNVGMAFDGNGQPQGVYADVTTNDGVQIARTRAGKGFESPPPPPQPTFYIPNVNEEQLRQEREKAKSVLHVDNEAEYNFGMVRVGYLDYCWQKNSNSEFLALANGRSWTTSAYTGFDAFSMFKWSNEDERLSMKSFVFEQTPLAWRFNRVFLGNKWYNHAFTNTGLDIMVPEGEVHYISALRSYTEKRKIKQQYGNIPLAVERDVVNEYFTESLWGIYSAYQNAQRINFLDPMQSAVFESQAQLNANAAMSYYDRAIKAANEIGSLAFNWTVAFAVPGGWENLQEFARGTRTAWQFAENVIADIAPDLVATGLGGFGMFSSRVGRTTIKVIRMGRQQARTNNNTSYMSGGGGGKSNRQATENVRVSCSKADADAYLAGLQNKRVLSNKKMTKDGHECYQFTDKCEHNGIKFKRGDYISRDELHHEWEWFRGPKNHQGAINPLTGEKYKKAVPGRELKLP